MQTGSTGLGKMTLKMKIADRAAMDKLPPTSPPKGALVLYAKTHDPVIWNLWVGLEPEDVPEVVKTVLKPSVLWFVLKSLIRPPFRGRKEKEGTLQTATAKVA